MISMIKIKLEELKNKRGYKDWSYRKLAKAIGISHLPLWKMLSGEPYNPSLDMLDKLCRFFKCTPGDIFEFRK